MKTITLTEAAIAAEIGRKELTSYMYDLVERGHKPSVLSGASLTGKAKKFGASYAKTRNSVFSAVHAATGGKVTVGTVLVNSRWSRVWVDAATGEPVTLEVTPA